MSAIDHRTRHVPGRINEMNPSIMSGGSGRDVSSSPNMPQVNWPAPFADTRKYGPTDFDINRRTVLTYPDSDLTASSFGETIEHLIYFTGTWYVDDILPWQRMEDGTDRIVWNEIIFDQAMAEPTPHLGVVTLLESERQQNSAYIVRHGKGFKMEHAHMNGPDGPKMYLGYLKQLALSSLEAVKADVIYSLLQAHDQEKKQEIEGGHVTKQSVLRAIEEEIWLFAAFQKYERAVNQLETRIRDSMARYGGEADSWILPQEVIRYVQTVPNEYLDYSRAGPRGPDIVFNLDAPGPFEVITGSKIYIARQYHTGKESLNYLESEKEIGEYYKLYNPFRGKSHKGYTSASMSTKIYDEPDDTFSEITALDALDHAYIFDDNGNPSDPSKVGKYPPNLENPNDLNRDIWKYEDVKHGKAEIVMAELFGELRPKIFSLRDKQDLAKTVLQAIQSDLGSDTKFDTTLKDFHDGIELLKKIEDIPYTDSIAREIWRRFTGVEVQGNANPAELLANIGALDDKETYFKKLAGSQSGLLKPSRSIIGVPTTFEVQSWPTDSTTGFLRENQNILDFIETRSIPLTRLLPGMQSVAGLRFLVFNKETVKAMGVQYRLEEEANIADRFLKALSTITSKLDSYFKNSIFLNPQFASSWWSRTDKETVFLENIMPYRPPMFMSTAQSLDETKMFSDRIQINDENSAVIYSEFATVFKKIVPTQTGVVFQVADSDTDVEADRIMVEIENGNSLPLLRSYVVRSLVSVLDKNPANQKNKLDQTEFAKWVLEVPGLRDGGRGGLEYDPSQPFEKDQTVSSVLGVMKQWIKKYQKTLFSNFESEEAINIFVENIGKAFQQKWSTAQRTAAVQRGQSRITTNVLGRTPLLTSPAFAATLASEVLSKNINNMFLIPADPDMPEVPISRLKLDVYTSHSEFRTDLTEVQKREASSPENLKDVPAWVVPIGSEQKHSVQETTFIANSRSLQIGQMMSHSDFSSADTAAQAHFGVGAFDSPGSVSAPFVGASTGFSSRDYGMLSGKKSGIEAKGYIDVSTRRPLSENYTNMIGLHDRLTGSTFSASWDGVNARTASILERAIMHVYEGTPITREAFNLFYEHNIVMPISFVLARPHMRYRTLFGIKVLAGPKTGATYYKEGMLEIADDAKTQSQFVSFTFYSKAVVRNPKNVRVAKHIMVTGYLGGSDVTFMDPAVYAGGMGPRNGSLMCIAVPYTSNYTGMFSLSGFLQSAEYGKFPLTNDGRAQYETLARYASIWGFGRNQHEYGSMGWDGPGQRRGQNLLCFPGTQEVCGRDGTYNILHPGKGHWGQKCTYRGAKAVRAGMLESFNPPATTGYELRD